MIVPDEEYLDFTSVPQSRGVPRAITYAVMVGIVAIFVIGAACCLLAGYGHVWPATQSTRMDLGPFHI